MNGSPLNGLSGSPPLRYRPSIGSIPNTPPPITPPAVPLPMLPRYSGRDILPSIHGPALVNAAAAAPDGAPMTAPVEAPSASRCVTVGTASAAMPSLGASAPETAGAASAPAAPM